MEGWDSILRKKEDEEYQDMEIARINKGINRRKRRERGGEVNLVMVRQKEEEEVSLATVR